MVRAGGLPAPWTYQVPQTYHVHETQSSGDGLSGWLAAGTRDLQAKQGPGLVGGLPRRRKHRSLAAYVCSPPVEAYRRFEQTCH